MSRPLKVTVYRDKWARGNINLSMSKPSAWEKDYEATPTTYLYDSETDSSCCLGFVGRVCGLSNEEMDTVSMPGEANQRWPRGLFYFSPYVFGGEVTHSRELVSILAALNDNHLIAIESVREAQIIKYGLLAGIEFSFQDTEHDQ